MLDKDATAKNKVQIIVPKGKTFANAEPLIYVQVFYHPDKQQLLDDFARVSNERWLAANASAKISQLPAVARTNGKPGFLRFASIIRRKRSRPTRSAHSGWTTTKTATNSYSTW